MNNKVIPREPLSYYIAQWVVGAVIMSTQLLSVTVNYERKDNCKLHLICIAFKFKGH